MCGLSGYVSKKVIPFPKNTIKTLGVFNDERGGDSCGIFIDTGKNKIIEYGVDKNALFSNFMRSSEAIKNTKNSRIILTHCRKRSVGVISVETAQPIIFKDSNGEIEYCVIHNGTIFNADDLWEKYSKKKLDSSLTDSQKMAVLFYHYGYDELANYNGAGAFVFIDYRKDKANPEILMFRGASLETHVSKEPTEERPLYLTFDKSGMFFSSIAVALDCVSNEEVRYLKTNVLCKYTEEGLVIVKNYDRSKMKQVREWASTNYSRKNGSESAYDNGYGDYDNYYGYNDYYNNKQSRKKQKQFAKQNSRVSCYPKITYNTDNGRFCYNGAFADGKFNVALFGYATSFNTKELWFYNGYLLKGGKELYSFIDTIRMSSKDVCSTVDEFTDYFINLLRKFSAIPVLNVKSQVFEIEEEYGNVQPYTGYIQIFFDTSYKRIYVNNGMQVETSVTSYHLYNSIFETIGENISLFEFSPEEETKLVNEYFGAIL